MTTMVSQITSFTVVYSTVYSDADQRKHQSSASLALCGEFTGTGEFPAQRANYAENVSIWWRHHGTGTIWSYAIWSQRQHRINLIQFVLFYTCHTILTIHTVLLHCSDITWRLRRRKSPAIRVFAQLVQVSIKYMKTLHHWPSVKWNHGWPVDSPHRGPVIELWYFSM